MSVSRPWRRRSLKHHISWTVVTLILTTAFLPVTTVSGQDVSSELTMATLSVGTVGVAKESAASRGFEISSTGINYVIPGKLAVGIMYKENLEEECGRYPDSSHTANDDEIAAFINIEIKF